MERQRGVLSSQLLWLQKKRVPVREGEGSGGIIEREKKNVKVGKGSVGNDVGSV